MSTQANPTEIWWPHPSAFDDLTVEFEDLEDGGSIIHLGAPDGTECAEWLAYFQETPERQEAFQREFMKSLKNHIQRLENGEIEGVTDQQGRDHSRGQEDRPGAVEEHESGSDSK
jgi:hypothetical protein